MSERLCYRADTLAEAMDVSLSHIKNLVYRGDLPAKKDGKVLIILAEDAKAYLESLPTFKETQESEESDQATI